MAGRVYWKKVAYYIGAASVISTTGTLAYLYSQQEKFSTIQPVHPSTPIDAVNPSLPTPIIANQLQIDPETLKICQQLFLKYVSEKENASSSIFQQQWNVMDFYRFLTIEQKQLISLEETRDFMICLKNEQTQQPIQEYDFTSIHLSFSEFLNYLFSETNSACEPSALQSIYHNMNFPLSYYLISASHNTYLEQDQLIGKSSLNAYKRALLNSCRCIEIDVWNGKEGQPVVFHGRTFTSKILFKDVLQVIKEYAFKTTSMPLIISLEVHCDKKQQLLMANYLKQIFGDAIVQNINDQENLPSPNQLLHKILLQGEMLEEESAVYAEEMIPYDCITDLFIDTSHHSFTSNQQRWNKELYELISLRATPFQVFDSTFISAPRTLHFNMSETVALKNMKRNPKEFEEWNKHRLTRIYPKWNRIGSSNYSPLAFWSQGCQLVSLNYQSNDPFMRILKGRFKDNGNCGLVLKPEFFQEAEDKNTVLRLLNLESKEAIRIRVLNYFPLLHYSSYFLKEKVYCSVEVASLEPKSLYKIEQFKINTQQLVDHLKHEFEHLTQTAVTSLSNHPEKILDDIHLIPSKDEIKETLFAKSAKQGIICFNLFKERKNRILASNYFPMYLLRRGYRYVPLTFQDDEGNELQVGGILVRIEEQR